MKTVNAGDLRFRVTIEEPVDARGANGGVVVSWLPVIQVWAALTPLSGRELIVARQSYADVTHSIEIRYVKNSRITNKCRINYNGRLFNILSVLNEEEFGIRFKILAKENLGA